MNVKIPRGRADLFRVQAWNALGAKVDEPSPPMKLKDALQLILAYRNRGLRRITLTDARTGEEFTDLELFLRDTPAA